MRQTFAPTNVLQLSTANLPPGQYRIFGLRTDDGVNHFPQQRDPWADGAALPVHGDEHAEPGLISRIIAGNAPCIVRDADLCNDPAVAHLLGQCRSLMATPILIPDLPINWLLILHHQPDAFRPDELEELILRTNLVGALIKGMDAAQKLTAANLRIAREIEQIARIQRTLLPSQLPDIPGLAIAAHYETFDQAGGDLYDFARMEGDPTTSDDDRWAILIADASGHGPAAATVCAIVHSILHAYPREPAGPAELLRHVNQHLCAKQIEASFVTAFLAFYQPATRELTYVRAGHNPPLLLSPLGEGGAPRQILKTLDDATGLPLGIDPDIPFNQQRLTLEPGQLLVLYTDGISEAKDPAGNMFGAEGILQAVAHCTNGPNAAVDCLITAVRNHQGRGHAVDDQTILVLEAT
jgi:sigma-B regulation protein RsbU (phosphoserine phosphatase)